MTTTPSKPKNTKLHILNAATRLFLQNGYHQVSLNEIAAESGIKKSSLYHHFQNKEQIFSDVVDIILPKTIQWINNFEDETNSFKDILEDTFNNLGEIDNDLYDFAGGRNVGVHYLMMDAMKTFPDLSSRFNPTSERIAVILSSRITKAQQNGIVRKDLDIEAFIFQFNVLLEGALLFSLMIPSIDLNDLGKRMFNPFWRGIAET